MVQVRKFFNNIVGLGTPAQENESGDALQRLNTLAALVQKGNLEEGARKAYTLATSNSPKLNRVFNDSTEETQQAFKKGLAFLYDIVTELK